MESELIFAASLAEALALKDAQSAFFAGGTGIGYKDSGIHAKKLIMIPGIPGIRDISKQEDGFIRIGALVTFTQALEDPTVPIYLKEALRSCGSLQKRNMATIGGNIASRRDDSYLIPTLIASGAMLCLEKKNGSVVTAMDAYEKDRTGYDGALITALLVKPETVRVLSKRFANTVESHAYLTISLGREGDMFRVGLAIKGCGIFCADIGNWNRLWEQAGVRDDRFGTEAYKRYITRVTLESMYEELGGKGGNAS